MKGSDLLKLIQKDIVSGFFEENIDIQSMTADSREVSSGSLFFCVKGHNADGHDFIEDALRKGAALVIGEKDLDIRNYIKVQSVKGALKKITPEFFDHPDRRLKMIAITGTNGKTSTALIIEKMIKDSFSCGVIGTLGYFINGRNISSGNTTPFNWKWYSLLNLMEKEGSEVVISEISSHALAEERIEDTEFDAAVFTNLTRDHLDFHGDIDCYFQAKKKLFTSHLKKDGIAVINCDDGFGRRIYEEMKDSFCCIGISDSFEDVRLKIKILSADMSGTVVMMNYDGKIYEVKIPVPGKFNIYNTLSAFAVCSHFIGIDKALSRISTKAEVPGRFEQIGDNAVFVDYAHSPDSLENVLKMMKELNVFRKIITVMGAGGDRDAGKRPLMGKIASDYSNIVIITDDNPRTEDPDKIVSDILKGCRKENRVIEVIRDRSLAIKRALVLKGREDAVLIAGKGAENYQITKDGTRYFSDKEEIEKHLSELQHVYDKSD